MGRSRWVAAVAAAVLSAAGFAAAQEGDFSALVNATASTQAEKARQGRLSYQLDQIANAAELGRALYDRGSRAPRYVDASSGRVTAIIELRDGARAEDLSRAVAEAGGSVEGAVLDRVKVSVPPAGLRSLAADPAVRIMRQPFYAEPKVVSQGVKVMKADQYISKTHDDGAGITVAVMDGPTFGGARNLIGSELPSDTAATPFVQNGSFSEVHGTACAEIVHDVAPGAKIILGGFSGDEVAWAQEIQLLVNSGADIITHSLGFDNVAMPNGKHFFAKVADAVNSSGVLFVTAAGNEAQKYYQGPWTDKDKNDVLEFKGKTENLPIYVDSGDYIRLRWDDSFGASKHDYDLYIFSGSGNLIAKSEGLQNGKQDPFEEADIPAGVSGKVYVIVHHDPSSPLNAKQKFWLYVGGAGIVDSAYRSVAGSLTLPADAKGAVAVGAVAYNTKKIEGYSSQGPTSDNRVKPDLAAPDKVATVSYGSSFAGTSAATPHAAGAAALILSHNPSMSVSALRSALQKATTSGGGKRDNKLGYGLIDLSKAK
jgi:subtilisin family serine protease